MKFIDGKEWKSFLSEYTNLETHLIKCFQENEPIKLKNSIISTLLKSMSEIIEYCETDVDRINCLVKVLEEHLPSTFDKTFSYYFCQSDSKSKYEQIRETFVFIKKYMNFTFIISKALTYMDKNYLTLKRKNSISQMSHNELKNFLTKINFFDDCLETLVSRFHENEIINGEKEIKENKEIEGFFQMLNIFLSKPTCNSKIVNLFGHYTFVVNNTDLTKSDFYLQHFETPMLKFLQSNYSKQFESKLKSKSTFEYVEAVNKILQKEGNLANSLYPLSSSVIEAILYKILVTEKCSFILNDLPNNFISILNEKCNNSCIQIYKLFSREVENRNILASIYSEFIGKELEKFGNNKEFMKNPIEFCINLTNIIQASIVECKNIFENDGIVTKKADKTIKDFTSEQQSLPKLLSFYSDFEFKSGMKSDSEEIMNKKIESILLLFMYCKSKDVFLNYHTINFSKRLLKNSTISELKEDALIEGLKIQCGSSAVLKMEKMKEDILDSETITSEFLESEFHKVQNEFSVKILSCSCWPELYQKFEIKLVEPLSKYLDDFMLFYESKFTKTRNLSWIFKEGSVEINAKLGSKKYLLDTTTIQANILLELESKGECKIDQFSFIEEKNIETVKEDAQELLEISIIKLKDGSDISTGIIIINDDFVSTSKRINTTPKPKKIPTKKEEKRDLAIDKEREIIIDMNIVKLMKQYKSISLQDLMEKVVCETTLFIPQPIMIKKRIELLIQREYIQRDEADQTILIYIP